VERSENLQSFLEGEASGKQFYFEYPQLLKMNKTSTSGRFGIPVRVPSDKDFSSAVAQSNQGLSTVESLRPADESTARRTQRQAHEKRLNWVKKTFAKETEEL
jgi:hypothetical protein